MTKRNKAIILLFAASVLALLAAVLCGIYPTTVRFAFADEPVFSAEHTLKDRYSFNESITLPDAEIAVSGENHKATEKSLRYPDGKIYSGSEFVLSEEGEYTAIYGVNAGGKFYRAEKKFSAIKGAYTVSGNSSSVSYGELTRSTGYGLRVDLNEGDELSINNEVYLDDETPFITFYPYAVYQHAKGMCYEINAWVYVIRLTDGFDPTNYIEIEMRLCSTNNAEIPRSYAAYFKAGVGDGVKAGAEVNKNNKSPTGTRRVVVIDGVKYTVFYGEEYGALVAWAGSKPYGFGVKYNSETKDVKINLNGADYFVSNLANTAIYDGKTFKGFTSNEVYLSMRAEKYEQLTADFEISTIGGLSGEALDVADRVDNVKPVVTLDGEFKENAKIALGEEFEIPSASTRDLNLVGDVSASVWYAYGEENASPVLLKDGKFTPNKEGAYTIVYSAKDSFGNVGTKAVQVNCLRTATGKTIDFAVDKANELRAGEANVLPTPVAKSLNGDVTVKVFAIFTATGETQSFNAGEAFTPIHVGEYEIRYAYTDGVKNYDYSYKTQTIATESILIDESSVHFPEVFIKNARYTLDKVQAYAFTSVNPVPVETDLFVSEDGGDFKAINRKNYLVGASSKVKFKIAKNGFEYITEEFPVADVSYGQKLDMAKYFYGNAEVAALRNSLTITPATGEDTLIKFVNALSLANFSVEYVIPQDKAEFKSFGFDLIDFYDRENVLTLDFAEADGKTTLSVNGDRAVVAADYFSGTNVYITYDPTENKFSMKGGFTFDCPTKFSTDKILVHIRFSNVTGASEMDLTKIGNQKLSNKNSDTVESMMTYDSSMYGLQKIGTKVVLEKACITDVLSPYLEENLILTFTREDGSFVVSDEGVTLDGTQDVDAVYTVTLAADGTYTVNWAYTDQAGVYTPGSIPVYVKNRVAPTLTINKNYNENTVINAGLNREYTVEGYTAHDDAEENVHVVIGVFFPDNRYYVVKDSEQENLGNGKFTPKIKGLYRVCYTAYDSENNYVMRYYSISVK